MSRRCLAVAAPLAAAFVATALVHLVPPPVAITWSFAHLDRHPALPVVAAMLLVVLPPLSAAAWRRPALGRPRGRMPWWTAPAAAAALGTVLVLAVRAGARPPALSLDTWWLIETVRRAGTEMRWYLIVAAYGVLARPLGENPYAVELLVRQVNAMVGAAAVIVLVAAVRRLARTRGEAAAMALLVLSAMGVVQLVPGYLDVYPVPLLLLAVYLWTAFRVLDGAGHPAWPLAVAAVAPFFYVGLLLVLPSAAVVVVVELRRAGGWRRLLAASAAAAAVAGAATVPAFGRAFAWAAWRNAVAASSKRELGLSPTSSLLPLDHLLSWTHAAEVAHTLFLVDPVGWAMLGTAGVAVAATRWREPWHPAVPLLLGIAVPYLAYLVAMDPLWGAYADWDLFAYQVAATAILASWAFVTWGRGCPRACGLLLGLALAAASTHLLARWNAMHVDLRRHVHESPFHVPVPDPF